MEFFVKDVVLGNDVYDTIILEDGVQLVMPKYVNADCFVGKTVKFYFEDDGDAALEEIKKAKK